MTSYDQALTLKPDYAEAYNNRGAALHELKRLDAALASYDQAVTLKPDYADAFHNRGLVLHELNRRDEALASYGMALTVKPDHAEAQFAMCMAELSILYENEPEIVVRRTAYERRLRALCDAGNRSANLADFAKGIGGSQPFYLAYQGYNDRDLQALYGSLVCRAVAKRYPAAALAPSPRDTEPVRVGIVSGFFRQHSNWKLPIKGWLSQLDRRRFQIFGYHTGVLQDAQTKAATALCDRFVQGPLTIDGWRAEISADAPHVLIYPEVGMDPISTQLAAQRLAPVQCNSWGHPDTSGFPTMDYYLSSDLMEPPDGQDCYTERLVRLPNLSVYCEPVDPPPASIARQDLGLRSTATVFWCAQSLYKYLPQFDEVFPRIARAAGDCQFAFIQYQKGAHITELFRKRLDRAFAAFGLNAEDHCCFLPRLDQHEFVAASGQCDIFLDSINWSGCNSTLESLVHDLPIVTMAGPLMRGRHSIAILRMMGVTETIAETIDDYVADRHSFGPRCAMANGCQSQDPPQPNIESLLIGPALRDWNSFSMTPCAQAPRSHYRRLWLLQSRQADLPVGPDVTAKCTAGAQIFTELLQLIQLCDETLQTRQVHIGVHDRNRPLMLGCRAAQFVVGPDNVLMNKQHEILAQPPHNLRIIPNPAAKYIDGLKVVLGEMRRPIGEELLIDVMMPALEGDRRRKQDGLRMVPFVTSRTETVSRGRRSCSMTPKNYVFIRISTSPTRQRHATSALPKKGTLIGGLCAWAFVPGLPAISGSRVVS